METFWVKVGLIGRIYAKITRSYSLTSVKEGNTTLEECRSYEYECPNPLSFNFHYCRGILWGDGRLRA